MGREPVVGEDRIGRFLLPKVIEDMNLNAGVGELCHRLIKLVARPSGDFFRRQVQGNHLKGVVDGRFGVGQKVVRANHHASGGRLDGLVVHG